MWSSISSDSSELEREFQRGQLYVELQKSNDSSSGYQASRSFDGEWSMSESSFKARSMSSEFSFPGTHVNLYENKDETMTEMIQNFAQSSVFCGIAISSVSDDDRQSLSAQIFEVASRSSFSDGRPSVAAQIFQKNSRGRESYNESPKTKLEEPHNAGNSCGIQDGICLLDYGSTGSDPGCFMIHDSREYEWNLMTRY